MRQISRKQQQLLTKALSIAVYKINSLIASFSKLNTR